MRSISSFLLFLVLSLSLKAQTPSVGTTDGVFDVSNLGGATYNIPLKLPEGVGGLQPTISLNYNSQSGNGIMGMGWSLSAISSITRMPNTIYHDKKVAGISMSSEDRFALDGNRLMVTQGSYGVAASRYRTEIETFNDITANGTLGSGPLSFTVTDQNGWIYEYGTTTLSRPTIAGKTEPYMWLLDKITDLNGNYITYSYDYSQGQEPLLKNIYYTGNVNTGSIYSTAVSFYYDARQDPNFLYIAGGKINQQYRLGRIYVQQRDATNALVTLRSYHLTYATDLYTHLLTVTEKGHEINGTPEQLPATTFQYGVSNVQNAVTQAAPVQTVDGEFITGDFNGDGFQDYVKVPYDVLGRPSNSWQLHLNNGSGVFTNTLSGTSTFNGSGNSGSGITIGVVNPGDPIYQRNNMTTTFDYDGDGIDEFLQYKIDNNTFGTKYLYLTIYKFKNNGTTYNCIANPAPYINQLPFVGDFDGDGRSEILLINTNLNTPGQNNGIIGDRYGKPLSAAVMPNACNAIGNTFQALNGLTFDAAYFPTSAKIHVMDYDGDGKSDMLVMWGSYGDVYTMDVNFDASANPVVNTSAAFKFIYRNTNYPTIDHRVFPGDFNGDGAGDVLTWKVGDGWKVGYGKGNGAINDIQNFTGVLSDLDPFDPNITNNNYNALFISDFDGDGKSDVFEASNVTTTAVINYSAGNNMFYPEAFSFSTVSNPKYRKHYTPADFNGDGASDFLLHTLSKPVEMISFRPHETRHLLLQIKDGLEAITKINYLPLTNSSVYSAGSSVYTYPFIKKRFPFKVVSVVNRDNATGTTGNNTNYTYVGLKFNAQGKGVMGFDQISAADVAFNTTLEQNYGLNTTYAFPFLQTALIKYGSITTNSSGFVQAFHDYGNKRILPYNSRTEKYDYINNTSLRVDYSFTSPAPGIQPDGYLMGIPNQITTRKGYTYGSTPSELELIEQKNSFVPYFTNPYPPSYIYSKPIGVVTATTCAGQPTYTRTEYFAYDQANGRLTGKTMDPGTSNAVTTSFAYDAYGNVTEKTISSSGLLPKSEVSEYDPSHRQVTKSYNTAAPSIETKSVYDLVTGNILQAIAPDGYTTTYTYDGFGREKSRSDNNGKVVNTNYLWSSGNVHATTFAKYLVETLSNTEANVYTFYDRLKRVSRVATVGFNGQMIYVDDRYDGKGLLARRSNPYFQGTTLQNSTFGYDEYKRLTYHNIPGGNNTTYSYAIVGNKYVTTITNAAGQEKKTYRDKSGKLSRTTDEGGTLEYTYHSNGNVKSVVLNNTSTVKETEYDAYGRLTKETDPNYGSYEYTYNAFGQLISKKDPKGTIYNHTYEAFGPMKTKIGPEGTYNYTYYTGTGANSGKLIQMTGPEGVHDYSYGIGDKVNYEQHSTGTEIFKTEYTYDNKGRVSIQKFPNSKTVGYTYNANDGSISGIQHTQGSGWLTFDYLVSAKNAFKQTIKYDQAYRIDNFGDPYSVVHTDIGYNAQGLLTGQKTMFNSPSSSNVLRELTYNFQPSTGNLLQRKDVMRNLQEDFSYDNLNRLISSQGQITGPFPAMLPGQQIDYSLNGNIDQKSDAGTFGYDQANRVSEIDPYLNIPSAAQNLEFTPFDKVLSIEEGNNKANFSYWADGERNKMELWENNVLKKTKYYAPDYEKEIDAATGVVRELCYVKDPEGRIAAILERKNGVDKTYYIFTDYLGSITHILDENGNIVEEKSFDAWGRARSPLTWAAFPATTVSNGWDRGYTSHEHMPEFGIINMNGRLYDPIMGRMFSPDPFIMGENNTQGYNRYTYAMNNPLSYTDPTGEIVWFAPIIIGAAVGAITGAIRAENSDMHWYDGLWRGAITGGVGGAFSMIGGGSFLGNVALGGVQGSITGMLDAGLWGNDVGKGALYGFSAGAAFAAITSGIEALGNYNDGYGFRTNTGVINHFKRTGHFDDAIDFVQKKYGFGFGKIDMSYDPTLQDYGETDLITGKVRISPSAFKSPSLLKVTVAHEHGHSALERKLINGKWTWTSSTVAAWNFNDGTIAYNAEINNAARMQVSPFTIIGKDMNPVFWHKPSLAKWLRIIPLRF